MKDLAFDSAPMEQVLTPEGYLFDNPIVTGTGIFEYENSPFRRQLRRPEDVFSEESLAIYEGKPIILTHRAGEVTKDNVKSETDNTKMKFGMGLVTSDGVKVTVPTSTDTADKFIGMALQNNTTEYDLEGKLQVKSGVTIGALRYGTGWGRVAPEVTVAYGESVYLINTGANAGYFTNVATDNMPINAKFIGITESNGVAPIEFYNQKAVAATTG